MHKQITKVSRNFKSRKEAKTHLDEHLETLLADYQDAFFTVELANAYLWEYAVYAVPSGEVVVHKDADGPAWVNGGDPDSNTPQPPTDQSPVGGQPITMTWLKPLATFAAQQVNHFFYRPTEAEFVTDNDYVVAVDDEWIMISLLGSLRLIHVSQLDEPVTRRNDPDAAFEIQSWNDMVAGDRGVKPSRVI